MLIFEDRVQTIHHISWCVLCTMQTHSMELKRNLHFRSFLVIKCRLLLLHMYENPHQQSPT